jgi:hypothetical protein
MVVLTRRGGEALILVHDIRFSVLGVGGNRMGRASSRPGTCQWAGWGGGADSGAQAVGKIYMR